MIVKIELDLDKEDDLLFYNRMNMAEGMSYALHEIVNNMMSKTLNELEFDTLCSNFDKYDTTHYIFEKIHEELKENGVVIDNIK
jgi:pyruvate-formate lyase